MRLASMKRSSVCPSVLLLSRQSTAASAAGGFAAEVGRGQQIDRSIAVAAARHVGRINFGPMLRRSDILAISVSFSFFSATTNTSPTSPIPTADRNFSQQLAP